MPRPERTQRAPQVLQRRTAWHPLFVRALRLSLPRRYFTVDAEHPLSQEPLRLDAVVIRRRRLPAGFRPRALSPLVQLLGDHTLISLKGATARLGWVDLIGMGVYAGLYCIEKRLRAPERVRCILVAPRLTPSFREQVARRKGRLLKLADGTWAVLRQAHVTYVIETERASDHVLHIFSRSFLRDPAAQVHLLTEGERTILKELFHDVQHFRKDPQAQLRYPDYEEVAMTAQEFIEAMVMEAPNDVRLKGMGPEERMEGLSPEQRLEGLSPEQLRELQSLLAQRIATPSQRQRRSKR